MNTELSQIVPATLPGPRTTSWPNAETVSISNTTNAPTSFDLLSPVYLTVGPIFFLVVFIIIWLLMVPNVRRPWSCRSHRKSTVIPLRQRGPGDAYEINPEMWNVGGGRLIGESVRTRDGRSPLRGYDRSLRAGSETCPSDIPMNQHESTRAGHHADGPPPYSRT